VVVEDDSVTATATRDEKALKALGCDLWRKGELVSLRELLKSLPWSEIWDYWHGNLQHKSGGLQFGTLAQALESTLSDSPKSGLKQWRRHQSLTCCPKRCERVPFPDLLSEEEREWWDVLVKYNLVGSVKGNGTSESPLKKLLRGIQIKLPVLKTCSRLNHNGFM
jgi:hypothetical protein